LLSDIVIDVAVNEGSKRVEKSRDSNSTSCKIKIIALALKGGTEAIVEVKIAPKTRKSSNLQEDCCRSTFNVIPAKTSNQRENE
jgi:hypothetical protein